MLDSLRLKKIVYWLVIVTVVSFGMAGIVFVSSNGKVVTTTSREFNQENSFKADGVKEISVDADSPDIAVIPVESQEIKVHYSGSTLDRDPPQLKAEQSSGCLSVKILNHTHNFFLGVTLTKAKLDIYVPKSYVNDLNIKTSSGGTTLSVANLNRLDFCSESGDLKASGLSTKQAVIVTNSGNTDLSQFSGELNFRSESGSLKASNLTTKQAVIVTDSGRTDLSQFSGDLNFRSESGNLKTSELDTKQTIISTNSGHVDLSRFNGGLEFRSESGELDADYTSFNNNVNVQTDSGGVMLNLPSNAGFALSFKSDSGELNSDFPITATSINDKQNVTGTVGSADNQIKVVTESGSFKLLKH